jgi:serine/threonine-protein kinase RsbT
MQPLSMQYNVSSDDFINAGEVSSTVKKMLKELGFAPEIIRRVAIAMYEAEINMVIHANGGEIFVNIDPDKISVEFVDRGPGIPNIDLAMKEGYSTASAMVRELGFGAGMGLPNIKKYADCVEVESEVGKGTKVLIRVDVK